jgi:rSAM/selenodomain-associated transferase 2
MVSLLGELCAIGRPAGARKSPVQVSMGVSSVPSVVDEVFALGRVSVIIPTLNEAASIEAALARLQPLRARGHEVIVADGGSEDGTPDLARPLADRVVAARRGRAHQMNAGAHDARGEILLFLHADTRLPEDADRLILDGFARSGLAWGRFDIRIDGGHALLGIVAWFMNRRSRLTSVCTGDQSIFVRRDLFTRLGGYPPIDLMEDIALSKLLRRHSRPLCIADAALTSARRWEARGVWRTVLLMWWLRLRYFLGASPEHLLRVYESTRR